MGSCNPFRPSDLPVEPSLRLRHPNGRQASPRDRPGDHRNHGARRLARRRDTRSSNRRVPAALPAARLGRARPRSIWRRSKQAVSGALPAAKVAGDALAAIGITNQRETTVVWDARPASRSPRDRLAGPPHGRAPATRSRRRGRSPGPREDGARPRRRTSPGRRSPGSSTTLPARAPAPTAGELAFGTIDSFLVHRSSRPGQVHVDGRDERVAHAPHEPRARRVGCGADARSFRVPAAVLPKIVGSAEEVRRRRASASCRTASPSRGSPGTSRRRSSARRASTRATRSARTGPGRSC